MIDEKDLQPMQVHEQRQALKPYIVKETIQFYCKTAVAEGRFTDGTAAGIRGAMIGVLNGAADGNHGRHKVLLYLFGVESTKDLDDAQWYALWRWMHPFKNENTGKWEAEHPFNIEVAYILRGGKNLKKPVAQWKSDSDDDDTTPVKDVSTADQLNMFTTEQRSALEIKEDLGY